MSQSDYRVLPVDVQMVADGNGELVRVVGLVVDRRVQEGFVVAEVIVAEPGRPLRAVDAGRYRVPVLLREDR